MEPEINAITGAGGFTGRHIVDRLLAAGKRVISLSAHPERARDLGDGVTSVPFNFDDPAELAKSLVGATVLYNTYWIRFSHSGLTFEKAVANSMALLDAAREAGVRRVVHVSITNPSADSPLPYFSGKARVESAIIDSGISHAVLRPTVIFGEQGILINNIAWFLRRLPAFAIPGSGEYRLQPVFVDDLADLAVEWGGKTENVVIDAVGPEVFTFNELVRLIARAVRSRALILHVNPRLALFATGMLGRLLGDVVLTRDEVDGLAAGLLVSHDPPTCPTKLTDWLSANASWLGARYFAEIPKHYR